MKIDEQTRIYLAGAEAAGRGDYASALELLTTALGMGLSGAPAVLAYAICSEACGAIGRADQATEMGEQALRLDRECQARFSDLLPGVVDGDIDLKESLLLRLDRLWVETAERLDETGRLSGFMYLKRKVALTDHLNRPWLPNVYYYLAERSAEIGEKEQAVLYCDKAIDGKLNREYPDDVVRHFTTMQVLAEMKKDELQKPRQTSTGCWVATVVYGAASYEVATLRSFRDLYLSKWAAGRALIALYYHTGPAIACVAKYSPGLRVFIRVGVLSPLLRAIAVFAPAFAKAPVSNRPNDSGLSEHE